MSVLIDIDSSNNIIFYGESFMSSRGETIDVGTEGKSIVIGKGASLFEAARNLKMNSSYDIDYSQCRAIIFTTKAASYGLDNFLDLFDRDQEVPQRSYVYVTSDDPKKILKAEMKEEKFVGIFLSELAKNMTSTSQGVSLRIDEFFNRRLSGSKVNVVNIVDLKKEQAEPRLNIGGLAVIKDDKLVGELTLEEGKAYNFLNNNVKQGTVYSTNPEHIDKHVALNILKTKTKTQLNYDGSVIHLKKKINMSVNLAFAEKSIHIKDQQQRNVIQKGGEEYVKEICENLFSKYQKKNIDIFNLQRDFEMRYPKKKTDNSFQITQLDLDINVIIKGSTITTDFK